MTHAKLLLMSLCVGLGSLAFADDPTPPNTAPPAATAATAPATADAASTSADTAKSAATPAKTATSSAGVTPEQAKTLRSAGYKADIRKGVTYYCRYETHVGSRFETRTCSAPEDILRSMVSSQELVNSMQHTVLAPAPMGGH
jgi:hypothetical protein